MTRSTGAHRLAIAAIASVLLLTVASSVVRSAGAEEDQTWTLMVYMAADVDSVLPWLQDLNEMEAAPASDRTDIIALVDPPGTGDTTLLHIENDPDYFDPELVSTELEAPEVIPGGGEVNTGSSATLRNFIVYSATHYPADRLVLVLWGHGAGWRGVCPDGTDILTLPELDSALGMAEETMGRGLDMIVLDVCDGATIELAFEVCEHADVIVGSEETVPAEGLPYRDVLTGLGEEPGQTVAEFGSAIADAYTEWATYGSSERTSMSVIGLGEVAAAVDGLSEVAGLCVQFDRLFHEETRGAFEAAFGYDSWTPDLGSALGGLIAADLPMELRVAAMNGLGLYTAAVLHHSEFDPSDSGESEYSESTGMTGYVCSAAASDASYLELDLSATDWDELGLLLRSEREDAASGPGPDVVQDDPEDGEIPGFVTVTWTPDDEWNYTGYSVYAYTLSTHGLTLVDEVHAQTPVVRVVGLLGHAMLSAAAFVDGEVYSYALLDLTVDAVVPVVFILSGPGAAEGVDLELTLVSENGGTDTVPFMEGACTAYLTIPTWAEPDDLVRLEVRDAGSGTLLAERWMRMPSSAGVTVSIDVPAPSDEAVDLTIPLSIVATLAILGVAAIVYWNALRRR